MDSIKWTQNSYLIDIVISSDLFNFFDRSKIEIKFRRSIFLLSFNLFLFRLLILYIQSYLSILAAFLLILQNINDLLDTLILCCLQHPLRWMRSIHRCMLGLKLRRISFICLFKVVIRQPSIQLIILYQYITNRLGLC